MTSAPQPAPGSAKSLRYSCATRIASSGPCFSTGKSRTGSSVCCCGSETGTEKGGGTLPMGEVEGSTAVRATKWKGKYAMQIGEWWQLAGLCRYGRKMPANQGASEHSHIGGG